MCKRRMSADKRRAVMASIHSKHTRPEVAVRKALTQLGARYRLHVSDLPGRPDVVMRSRRLAVFVHGCLWHLHEGCPLVRVPRTRADYWPAKLAKNRERDRRHAADLRAGGWKVAVVWECQTTEPVKLRRRLRQLLANNRAATA